MNGALERRVAIAVVVIAVVAVCSPRCTSIRVVHAGSFMHRPGSRTNTGGCPRVAGRESGCASFVAVNTGMGGSTGTGACVMACGTNSAGGLT